MLLQLRFKKLTNVANVHNSQISQAELLQGFESATVHQEVGKTYRFLAGPNQFDLMLCERLMIQPANLLKSLVYFFVHLCVGDEFAPDFALDFALPYVEVRSQDFIGCIAIRDPISFFPNLAVPLRRLQQVSFSGAYKSQPGATHTRGGPGRVLRAVFECLVDHETLHVMIPEVQKRYCLKCGILTEQMQELFCRTGRETARLAQCTG